MAARPFPSGVNVSQEVTDREPPDLDRYSIRRSSPPVAASRKSMKVPPLTASVVPSGDRPTVSTLGPP